MPGKDIGDKVQEEKTKSFIGSFVSGLRSLPYNQSSESSELGGGYRGVMQTGPGQGVVVYDGKVLGNASLYREKR